MRALLINLLATLLTAAVGFAICRALSIDPHGREMLISAGACLLAADLAVVPLILVRGASQLAVSQAGLIATAVHLFVALGIALAVSTVLHAPQLMLRPFLFWLLALYWMTLIGLCASIILAIRAAPPAPASKQGQAK